LQAILPVLYGDSLKITVSLTNTEKSRVQKYNTNPMGKIAPSQRSRDTVVPPPVSREYPQKISKKYNQHFFERSKVKVQIFDLSPFCYISHESPFLKLQDGLIHLTKQLKMAKLQATK